MKFGDSPMDPRISPEAERAAEEYMARAYRERVAREVDELLRWWEAGEAPNPHLDHPFREAA